MWLKIGRVALKFHSHLGSNSAKSSIDMIKLTPMLAV